MSDSVWPAAISAWETSLIAAGRVPRVVASWVRLVRRAAALADREPDALTPSQLLGALLPTLASDNTKRYARTAVRSFYLHRGTTAGDPVMTRGRTWDLSPEWSNAITDWEMWLRVSGRSVQTIWLRTYYLRRAAENLTVGPWEAKLEDLLTVLDSTTWALEARKTARAGLRSFYTWAMDVERITVDPTRKLPPIHTPAGRPRPAPDSALETALANADESGRLMVLLAAYAGLRRAEIAAVHSRDIDGASLRVVGKGNRVRVIPLHPTLEEALAGLYGYAFPGRFNGGHVSPDKVGKTLSRLLGPGWTAHTLRHRFASRAYAAERDIRAVQELLGHSKLETTQRYTAIPDGALRAAVLAAG